MCLGPVPPCLDCCRCAEQTSGDAFEGAGVLVVVALGEVHDTHVPRSAQVHSSENRRVRQGLLGIRMHARALRQVIELHCRGCSTGGEAHTVVFHQIHDITSR